MPTNLPPEAEAAEQRYREAVTIPEKIRTLEEYISAIPKHKGTDKLRADLRRRLSKLKDSSTKQKGTSKHTSAFQIEREGAGQAVVLGPPNVGKSALVEALTNAQPEVSPSPFTTWVPMPGMMLVDNVQIQLIDTPPINSNYMDPELLNMIRQADLMLLVVNLQRDPLQQLEDSLSLLKGQRIVPRHLKENEESQVRLTYIPLLVLVNKFDNEDFDEDFDICCQLLEEEWPLVPVSAKTGRNLDLLKKRIFEELGLIRVFSKPPGKEPDRSAPFVLEKGSTLADFAGKVHKDFLYNLKGARVWGQNVYDGQMVSRDHILHEGDVVELRI
jgi:small GTP-binding protein